MSSSKVYHIKDGLYAICFPMEEFLEPDAEGEKPYYVVVGLKIVNRDDFVISPEDNGMMVPEKDLEAYANSLKRIRLETEHTQGGVA